ncbi:hypothetical protein Misp01_33420 [Microtetraspora sp. NBRC 13810]|nr:hypothetical protein Misp01_33420 [Microtetraspora sp. NBRC 13810]
MDDGAAPVVGGGATVQKAQRAHPSDQGAGRTAVHADGFGDDTETASFTARGSSEHYGKSKLLDIMFTMELARRLAGSGVTATCLDQARLWNDTQRLLADPKLL